MTKNDNDSAFSLGGEIGNSVPRGVVASVGRSTSHGPGKPLEESIVLLVGLGVEGDAHMGATVKHRSRARKYPGRRNLRQVHLIHGELLDELRAAGFEVTAGDMGENITTRGIDLLGLPAGTVLRIGGEAAIEVTGLRNPCNQLEGIQAGLMEATLERGPDDELIRKAGIMAVVQTGGDVRPGDAIVTELPPEPHRPLEPV